MGSSIAAKPGKKGAKKIEYTFDQAKVDHVIGWIETYCTHPVGDLQGQPLIIPEWYKRDFIAPFFGWKKPNGKRKHQEAYLEIGSGNAKSTLGTAVALYFLCADGQMSPRVYSVAGSRDQAGIIFNAAKIMVQQNEDLSAAIQIFQTSLVIKSEFGMGIFKALSADMKLQEGLNPTAVLMDETHVQKDGNLYNGLKKNFPKRAEPAFISMTTAGIKYTWAEELHDKAVKVRDGQLNAPGFLSIIYAADLDGDDFDEEQWKLANPGWDYLNIELLRQEAEDAKESSTGLAAFRRYHLNKWTGAKVQWLSDDLWMRGTAGEEVRIEDLKGRHCYVGLDMGSKHDTTAAVFAFPPIKSGERWKILTRIYLPEPTLVKRVDNEAWQFVDWKDQGYIITTPREMQDYESIRADIESIGKQCVIDMIAYDAWNANETVQYLEAAGLKMLPYGMGFKYMNAPMDKLESLVRDAMIEHSGNPVLRWMNTNTEAEMNGDMKRPTKSSDKARIDGMVALIVAIGCWIILQAEPVKHPREIIVSIKRQ